MSEEAYARYFADRELFERAMTRRAKDLRVAAIHAELAERYEALESVRRQGHLIQPRIADNPR